MASKTIYQDIYRQLVSALRTRREQCGFSQGEVARSLGWSQQKLSAIEAGARRLDVLEFVQLTYALHLDRDAALNLLFSHKSAQERSKGTRRSKPDPS